MVLTMGKFFAGLVGWSGLGIIITEILNSAQLFEFRLNPYWLTLLIIMLYCASIWISKQANREPDTTSSYQAFWRNLNSFNKWLYGLIGLIAILSIPYLWWLVIKKLSGLAAEGIRLF